MRSAIRVALVLCVVGIRVPFASAAPPAADQAIPDGENPYVWKSCTSSVSVFKNGMGFFMREGEVGLRDGWCLAKRIPPASFGTLVTYSHEQGQTVDVVGAGPGEIVEFDGHDAPADLPTKRQHLRSVRNLSVELTYSHRGSDRKAAGELVSVGDDFAVLEGPQNTFAVPLEGIRRMQLLDLPLRIHVAGDAQRRPERTKLGMAYLRKGITWIPEYSLKVLDDKTAEITLRGTVVNEAEDLIHCDLNLVVGVPHFMHTDYLAPIAVGQAIRTIGAAVAPPIVQSQIMNRAAIVSNFQTADQFAERGGTHEQPVQPDAGNLDEALGGLPAVDDGAGSDYTVYTKKDVTLRRGEKAIFTLFTAKVAYSHTYRWSIPNRIEHFLLLHNGTGTAWTTGPCLAMDGVRPLTEDLLKYTPKGGSGRLAVTTAINIAHEHSEREVDRELKAHSPSHNVFFDLVELEGTLKLRNFEKREAPVTIVAPVAGKPISAGNDAVLSVDSSKLRLLERAGAVRWQITLEPGESKTLTYRYQRYVPSN